MFVVTKGDAREFLIAGCVQKKIGYQNDFGFYRGMVVPSLSFLYRHLIDTFGTKWTQVDD